MNPDEDDKPVDALDAMYEDLARHAAEEGTAAPADRAWAARMQERVMARLAAHRRALAPDVTPRKAPPIRPSILAMSRDALLAAIEDITQRMGGAVQIAHRHLKDLSDDDLRRVLETLEAPPE